MAKMLPVTLAGTTGRFANSEVRASTLIEQATARAQQHEDLGVFAELPGDEIGPMASSADVFLVLNEEPLAPIIAAPIAISDNIVTRWGTTRAGTRMLDGYRSPFSATAVEALLGAIAIPFGKTTVSELGIGPSTRSSSDGPVQHPANSAYVPGGPSGGAIASVAAGIVPAALAVDTLGGLRQPAAHCGVVGFRPTYGAVSRRGVVACGSSFDSVGVVSNSVRDAAAVFDVIAGHDPRDGTSRQQEAPSTLQNLDADFEGLRVGIAPELLALGLSDAARHAVEQAQRICADRGAKIVEVSLPSADVFAHTAAALLAAEAATNFERFDGVRYGHRTANPPDIDTLYSRSRAEGFGSDVIATILLGTHLLSEACYGTHYQYAQRVRRTIVQHYNAAFASCDVLLGAVNAERAPSIDGDPIPPLQAAQRNRFTAGEALASLPAITLPVSTDADGLSTGIQLSAAYGQDAQLLRIAHCIERWLEQEKGGQKA